MTRRMPLGLRCIAALLLAPVTVLLCGGPLASSAIAQQRQKRDRIASIAARVGLDPEAISDPDAYARRQAEQAKARRAAALAKLPRYEQSAAQRAEVEQVQQAQALHTLAGRGRDLKEGLRPDESTDSPALKRLRTQVQQSRVRMGTKLPPPERPEQHFKATLRGPRTAAPESWSRPMRDLRAIGGRLRYTGEHLPRWENSLRGAQKFFENLFELTLTAPSEDDLAPTIDAQSTHPLIVAKAQQLGNDPVRIYNFVQDTIATELYAGSKKGALGTLREGSGNHVDQASLLVALYRAADIPARYELGTVAMTPAQANEWAGTLELSVSASLIGSAGIANTFISLGPGQGVGLSVEHVWVRAFVPTSAYRGIARPGAVSTWVHLAPSIKQIKTQTPVDLRDAVLFDFNGYMATRREERPVEWYASQLRTHIQQASIACETLDSAQPKRTIVPDGLPLLPADLPVRRVLEVASMPELPADQRHRVRFTGRTSQNVQQFTYEASMPELWGKGVTLVYEPSTANDAQIIASHGGIENTPAYQVRMTAALKIDGQRVAQGASETPGLDQRLAVDLISPETGTTRVEHALIVSGVYGLALDPGLVPTDLINERVRRYGQLSGDDLEAEKLYVTALTYFHDLNRAREQIAGLHWHRIYKEVEEAAAFLPPRVEEYNGVPLSVSRDFFTFDAPGVRFGDYSIDGNNTRTFRMTKLIGYEGSFLEHRMSERFRGPDAYSAVRLIQVAHETGVQVLSFSQGNLEEALMEIQWPLEREERLRDFANRGYTIEAPVYGYNHPELGMLYGFIAIQPGTGVGAYIIGTMRGEIRGGEGPNSEAEVIEEATAAACIACNDYGSPVHLLSGTLPLLLTDLVLPARGTSFAFGRAYHARGGWTHNFAERLEPLPDGSLRWIDERGFSWTFAPDNQSGVWAPPRRLYQRIEATPSGFSMLFTNGVVHRFDTLGRLASRTNPNGQAVTFDYGVQGRLVSATAPGGHRFDFTYDGNGHLSGVTDTAGRGVQFVNDGTGNITSETDVLGETRSYSYDAFGRMRTRTDFRGNVYRMDYDSLDRVVRIEDPNGGVDTYAYDHVNRRTVHTDRRDHPLYFELNEIGKVVRKVDALGNETLSEYDSQGNKTRYQDSRGNVTTYTFDDRGNTLTHTEPTGATTHLTYNALSQVTSVTDVAESLSTMDYDSAGNLLSETNALGETTVYTYTSDGLLETSTAPGGATTTWVYNTAGSVLSITDPEGSSTTMAYDAAGHAISATDPGGPTRSMVVDAKGNLLEVTDSTGATTSFDYDPDGNRISVTGPDGEVTRFEYDALSHLVAVIDANGDRSTREYDPEGNLVARVNARGYRVEMQYDAIGRLVESCDANGRCTAMTYCGDNANQPADTIDALGNVTRVECDVLGREASRTDPLGNVTRTVYDLLGRRSSVTDGSGNGSTFGYDSLGRLTSIADANGGVTSIGYDARGNRTTITDANGRTSGFDYDLADHLVREITPIGTETVYRYDAAGRLADMVDAKGQTTEYVYDAAGRVASLIYDDGSHADVAYDLQGRRIFEQNEDSTREMTYDAVGQLSSVVDVDTGRTIEYEYDAAGNRTSMRVLPDGELTTYAWDANSSLTRMTDPEGGEYRFSTDQLGRRVATSYPDGMVLHTVYDDASRVIGMVYVNAARQLIDLFGYSYDERGNRTAKIFGDGSSELYGYDDLDRLVRVTYPSGRVVHYTYDAVGNRLSMTEGTAGSGPGECAGDADCDGVPDATDNCPAVANANQTDSDAAQINTPGASAIWRFNEASGATVLDSVGTNHGTIQGAVRVTGERFGTALRFDGVNDAVTVPDSAALKPAQLTVEAWGKPTTLRSNSWDTVLAHGANSGGPLASSGDSYFLGFFNQRARSHSYHVGRGDLALSATATTPLNQWTHLAFTFDGSEAKLYQNGSQVSSQAALGALIYDSVPLAMGDDINSGVLSRSIVLNGLMDEAAVYPRALNPSEIAQHAQVGLYGDGKGDACDACPSNAASTCTPLTCQDHDGDGYGPQGASACPRGLEVFDCNDSNAAVHPGTVEACDSVDNDCDGQVDEQCLNNTQVTTYSYNNFNQLLSETGPAGLTAFDYDLNGNLVSKTNSGGTETFVYDARDRMVERHTASSEVQRFGYDAQGLRVRMESDGEIRRVLLDANEELAEYGVSTRLARYDHDPEDIDRLLAQREGGATYLALVDGLGSLHGLRASDGARVASYSYDAFGSRTQVSGTVSTPWGFAGRRHEADDDIVYMRQRYLDASVGRFLSTDPAGMADGPNRYWFTRANPIIAIDPMGLAALIITGAPPSSVACKMPNGKRYAVRVTKEQWEEQIGGLARSSGLVQAGEAMAVESVRYQREYEDLAVRYSSNEAFRGAKIYYIGHLIVCGVDTPSSAGCGNMDLRSAGKGDIISAPSAISFAKKMRSAGMTVIGCNYAKGGTDTTSPDGVFLKFATNMPRMKVSCTPTRALSLSWEVAPSFEPRPWSP